MVRYVATARQLLQNPQQATHLTLHFAGYHIPAVRKRDAFYQKLEDKRAKALGTV